MIYGIYRNCYDFIIIFFGFECTYFIGVYCLFKKSFKNSLKRFGAFKKVPLLCFIKSKQLHILKTCNHEKRHH